MASQRKNLKRCMSGISGRRKRKETVVSIRKAKREDGYAARRNMAAAQKSTSRSEGESILKDLGKKTQSLLLALQNPESQVKALLGFRLLMSSGLPPLFDEEDEEHAGLWNTIMNAVPAFIAFLEAHGNVQAQSDAAFALRFIASMDRAKYIVSAQAIPKLVVLLHSGITELQVQSAWCLGNIAGESAELCIEVLKHCPVSQVLPHIRMSTPTLRRAAVWLLRNICDYRSDTARVLSAGDLQEIVWLLVQIMTQLVEGLAKNTAEKGGIAPWRMFQIKTGKPAPNDIAIVRYLCAVDDETVQVVDADVCFDTGENEVYSVKMTDLRPLECVDDDLEDADAEDVLDERALTICDSCWTLAEISLPDSPSLQQLVEANICPLIVQILQSYQSSIMISPALRVIGNIVSGTEEHVKAVLESKFLSMVPNLLFCRQRGVREETCWALSNIAGGAPELVNYIILEPNLLVRLAEQLKWAEWDVLREAAWAVCNIIIRVAPEHLPMMLQLDVLSSFSDLLDERDPQVTLLILEALDSILNNGKKSVAPEQVNPYAIAVEEAGCLSKIETLCYDENQEVSDAASHILDHHFGSRDINDAADFAPSQDSTQSMFVFKAPETTGEFKFGGS